MFPAAATTPGEADLVLGGVGVGSLRTLREDDISIVTTGSRAGEQHRLQVTVPSSRHFSQRSSWHKMHFRVESIAECAILKHLVHFHEVRGELFNAPRLAGATGAELGLALVSERWLESAIVNAGRTVAVFGSAGVGARGVRLPWPVTLARAASFRC